MHVILVEPLIRKTNCLIITTELDNLYVYTFSYMFAKLKAYIHVTE